ncbi:hypothetical protein C8Q70DRAFT_368847 [Cubamyces menziesii]|nr:hypothetical protein C8Q70DRAFT_368847 [Cubamyces menziesii]
MSTESATAKKRASAATPKRTSEDDHRRKRRNRPTQSCLNCHTSKRMCDRQRPCGRCTQLGLTGLCVYEVDNPSHRANAQDEAARLQKRVAELESIIRELKNKPHPRWAQSGSATANNSSTTSLVGEDTGAPGPSVSKSGHSTASFPTLPKPLVRTREPTPSSPSALLQTMPGPLSGIPGLGTPSPLATPSPDIRSPIDPYPSPGADIINSMLHPEYDLSTLLSSCQTSGSGPTHDGYLNDMLDTLLSPSTACPTHSGEEHCGCLNDHTSYNTVLELSLRLRRATEILSQYAKHGAQSDCKVHRGISELDRFTTTALGNILTPPEPVSSQPHTPPMPVANPAFGRPSYPSARPSQNGHAPHALQSPRAWDFKSAQPQSYPSPPWDDSFMSWEPLRQSSEWPQGGL